MVGRSQLGSQGDWRRPLQYEKERMDSREMCKKEEGKSGKTARGAGLYTLEKAAGGAMPGALPEEAALGLEAGKGGHFTGTQIIQ